MNTQAVPSGTTVYYNTEIITTDNITYAIVTTENGKEAHLLQYKGNDKNIVVPATINGISVTQVMSFAFAYQHSVEEITLPDSITLIDYYAFCNCDSLTKINIPSSINYIGPCAFLGCANLIEASYPGTAEQWNNITVEGSNNELINALPF